jgi:hypothetical protein
MKRVAPAKVRKEAKLGLLLRKKWKRGGTAVGVARAVQLYSGKAVSDQTIKRMYSYFQRHQHDRLDKDGSDGKAPGNGYIAWLLWGGDSGRKWAEREYKKIKKTNPIKRRNPARNVFNPEAIKNHAKDIVEYLRQVAFDDEIKELEKWIMSNYVKGIINSDSTEHYFTLYSDVLAQQDEFESDEDVWGFDYRYEPVEIPDWAKKALERGEKVYYFPQEMFGDVAATTFFNITGIDLEHFVDFATSESFPRNISRISFDQMWQLVREWDEKNKNIKLSDLYEGKDEIVFKEYDDGFKWVRMLTREALVNEAARMGGLCIASASSHSEPILKGLHLAFSLRDAEGEPRVTVEYIGEKGSKYGKPNSFREIKGYANDEYEDYGEYVADLMLTMPNHDIYSTLIQAQEDLWSSFSGLEFNIIYLLGDPSTLIDFVSAKRKKILEVEISSSHYKGKVYYGKIDVPLKNQNPTKKQNPTKEEEVNITKDYLLELARECGKRPPQDTALGKRFSNYLMTDKAFKEKIKELCPKWFRSSQGAKEKTKAAMEMFLEMARNREKRPAQHSKDPEEKKLGKALTQFLITYPEFEEKIYQANREWTGRGQIEVIRETKNHLIELARECGTRPPQNTSLGYKLNNYLQTDKAFKEKIKELCPDWLRSGYGAREKTIVAMEMFLEMARNGEKRPNQRSKDPEENKLGKLLASLLDNYPEFRKKLLEANRDWFTSEKRRQFLAEYKEENPTKEEEVQATKEYLLELARECGKRPPISTNLGKRLQPYLRTDEAFREKVKELCPKWFRSSQGAKEETKAAMEMFLEMARNGEKRPSQRSKDPEEKRLANTFTDLIRRDPEFEEKIYQANREWTGRGKAEVIKETKNHFLELARECGTRPPKDTALGDMLNSHLTKDKAFKKKMKELCPDWFKGSKGAREETKAAMEMFLEMVRNGEKRPSSYSKDPEEKKFGILLNSLLTNYPDFRKKLLEANRDWFASEERKRFLSEYKEENPLSLIARGFDERPASNYDKKELMLGIKIELEHTDDAIIASKIAKDHLDEDSNYYSKLIEMERA